jgi:hypothetical protein
MSCGHILRVPFITLLAYGLLSLGVAQAQDKAWEKKTRELEQKISVLEDYLKERAHELSQELQARERLLQEVKAQNAALYKEMSLLKERLELAERELLHLKIAFSGSKSEAVLPITLADSKTTSHAKEEETIAKGQPYQNAQVQKLSLALKSREAALRIGAIVELNKIDDDEATTAITDALCDSDTYVRMLACKALAQRKAMTALSALWPLAKDGPAEVRAVAIQTIEKITGIASGLNTSDAAVERDKKVALWQEKIKAQASEKK